MDQRRGYLAGFAAYALWGFFPLYFHQLLPAGAVEILAHRVVWSLVVVAVLTVVLRRWRDVLALRHRPRTLAGLALAAVLIGINWGVYIYGVNSDQVIETSLGYFINPLVSVLFGVFVFKERLRRPQWAALALGAAAFAVITAGYGRLPWIALTLALSFGGYGLVKKVLAVPPTDGLLLESATLALPALAYLLVISAHGTSTFTSVSAWHTVALIASGVVTAGPLLLFAEAANRIPLTAIGMMQYVTPILQLACGLVFFHEKMPTEELAGFCIVWLALAVFTWDALAQSRPARRASNRLQEPGAIDVAGTM